MSAHPPILYYTTTVCLNWSTAIEGKIALSKANALAPRRALRFDIVRRRSKMASDRYFHVMTNTGQTREYRLCEASDGDGWTVCWHLHTGTDEARQRHHPFKRLGCFQSIEDAQPSLDKLAIKLGMKYFQEYPEPTRSGIRGEWVQMEEEDYG